MMLIEVYHMSVMELSRSKPIPTVIVLSSVLFPFPGASPLYSPMNFPCRLFFRAWPVVVRPDTALGFEVAIEFDVAREQVPASLPIDLLCPLVCLGYLDSLRIHPVTKDLMNSPRVSRLGN